MFIRFIDESGTTRHGEVDAPVSTLDPPKEVTVIDGDPFVSFTRGATARVKKVLYPFEPAAILGIGANYKGLFSSGDRPTPEYPVVFFKLQNALANPGDPILLPRKSVVAENVKFEGELCVVIGKGGKNISQAEAMDHVFGYTIANDVSGSDWQRERVGNQWAMGKGFDTFCPFGPAVIKKEDVADVGALQIITKLGDTVEQNCPVSELLFPIPRLIEFLSAAHTIPDHSIILTGTPPGARFVQPGERVDITIDPIGTLSSPVTEE